MPFRPTYFVKEERQPYTEFAQIGNGRVGILMLHGFLGSPLSSHPMARYLAKHGITVHCPLLPGHGQYPDKLKGARRQDWLDEAIEGYEYISSQCDDVFVMGHSMGSVLCADLCRQHPDIRGIIMLTPVYDPPDDRLKLMLWLQYVMPWFYPHKMRSMRNLVRERVLDYDSTLDFDSPEVQARLPAITRIPTRSLAEMVKMIEYGKTLWPHLNLPAILFKGNHDPAVKPGTIEVLYETLPGPDKHIHVFPESGHEVMRPLDPAHKMVWPTIYQFIRKHSQAELPELADEQQTAQSSD